MDLRKRMQSSLRYEERAVLSNWNLSQTLSKKLTRNCFS